MRSCTRPEGPSQTRATAVLLAVVLAVGGSGCAGEDGGEPPEEAGAERSREVRAVAGRLDSAPGRVLVRFVEAAARGDAAAMWDLLTWPTRKSIGPTFADFRRGAAVELREGVGTLAGTPRVVLSRVVVERWGAAALAGQRLVDGELENFAYGAALVREGGGWRLELGGVVIGGLEPEPLSETDAQPAISANVAAGGDIEVLAIWLDGKPLPAVAKSEMHFAAEVSARPRRALAPGRHEVVVFALSDVTASAIAWTFSVQG